MAVERVVSLIASATEIVCALGCGERLVGCSHECDYPAERVDGLPVCTVPKFDTEGTSYQIDQRVKAILQEALSVYRVDAALLRSLEPDVIVTQTQCEVCAVSPRDVVECLSTWTQEVARPAPRMVALEPNLIEDVWADVRRVAEALDVATAGETLVQTATDRMGAIAARASALTPKPRVACIEWIEPLMAAGNWMPQLVEMAGGISLFGVAGTHSPWMSWEALHDADPDLIVVLPCGYDIAESQRNMAALSRHSDWPTLRAVRTARVFIADGSAYFNRPGPRLVDSLEMLADILHPDTFDHGHEGVGWVGWPAD
jgi:iron complex transport system substrate-binding protein